MSFIDICYCQWHCHLLLSIAPQSDTTYPENSHWSLSISCSRKGSAQAGIPFTENSMKFQDYKQLLYEHMILALCADSIHAFNIIRDILWTLKPEMQASTCCADHLSWQLSQIQIFHIHHTLPSWNFTKKFKEKITYKLQNACTQLQSVDFSVHKLTQTHL